MIDRSKSEKIIENKTKMFIKFKKYVYTIKYKKN